MRSESGRLYLRKLTVDDVTRRYADWLNDPDVNRFLETRHSVQSIESCRRFVEEANQDPNSHLFGIFLAENNVHIGNAKIGFVDQRYKTGQMSLFIGEKTCWGKGYAQEVIKLLTKIGFYDLGLERIEAGCYEKNMASLRAFLMVGYTVEGFFRKKYISDGERCGAFWLGLLKSEYAPVNCCRGHGEKG